MNDSIHEKDYKGEVMNKPELLVTPMAVADIVPLIEAGANAFVIGEERFGLRLAGQFSKSDIKEAVTAAHQANAKIYVAVNAIFHNQMLEALDDYLVFLAKVGVDAIIFGDPAMIIAARELAPGIPLHWSTETTGTNYITCNYWGEKGATRAVLARELSLEEVVGTKEKAHVAIEVLVHGMTCMFQSKRTLIDNYFNFQNKQLPKVTESKSAYLHDKERDAKYPIFQDINGTHIMSPNDVCMIEELSELIEAGIDSFKIDAVLKDFDYLIAVTRLYRSAIDLIVENPDEYERQKTEFYQQIEALQPTNRPLDTGFYFKETVY